MNKETDMAKMKTDPFRKLAECIKESGRWIEENAESIAPNVEYMTSMTIRINIEPEEAPTINIDYDVVSLKAAKAWAEAHRGDQ